MDVGGEMNRDILLTKIDELLKAHTYDQMMQMLLQYKDIAMRDNDLATVGYLLNIHNMERDAGQRSVLEKVNSISELLERHTILKFYLMRLDHDFIGDGFEDFKQYVMQSGASAYELLTTVNYTVFHKEKVLSDIQPILMEIM